MELIKMQDQIDSVRIADEPKFLSIFRLYYKDEKLADEFFDIESHLGYLTNFLYRMVNAENEHEFREMYSNYNEEFKKILKMTKQFNKKLIDGEIQVIKKNYKIFKYLNKLRIKNSLSQK